MVLLKKKRSKGSRSTPEKKFDKSCISPPIISNSSNFMCGERTLYEQRVALRKDGGHRSTSNSVPHTHRPLPADDLNLPASGNNNHNEWFYKNGTGLPSDFQYSPPAHHTAFESPRPAPTHSIHAVRSPSHQANHESHSGPQYSAPPARYQNFQNHYPVPDTTGQTAQKFSYQAYDQQSKKALHDSYRYYST